MAMKKTFTLLLLFLSATSAHATYHNNNGVLIGDRAAGMGGAFTAMVGDPAASPYYNPAGLGRLEGTSLSTSVSLYNKYDVTYGSQENLNDALFRINKGSILTIPSASGIFNHFGNFTAGLSILVPNFQNFGGNVQTGSGETTFLRLNTESLWVGGSFAFNPDEFSSLGFSFYYTSDSTSRSLSHRYIDGADEVMYNEEKTLASNSFVAIIGYLYEWSPKLNLGLSYRFPSVPVHGEGSYLSSQVGTVSGAQPVVSDTKVIGETNIPDRLAAGLSYQFLPTTLLSFDLVYFGENQYQDMVKYGDDMNHAEVINFHLGVEHKFSEWLAARIGFFTDNSSAPEIPNDNPTRRYVDHIDKLGFAANITMHATQNTHLTLGGYYLGGDGEASERSGAGFTRITKQERLFSFLVSSGYHF